MRRAGGQNFPQYDDADKQEAARFLCSDFSSVHGHEPDDHLHAKPVIRGIDDLERLNAWTEVAKDQGITGPDRRALKQRRQALTGLDESTDEVFDSGADLTVDAESESAVADGGADLGTADQANDGVSREIGADQERREYEDDAAFESAKREAADVAKMYESADAVEDALDEQYGRDVVQPHIIDALQERLEVLEQ